MTVVTVKNPSFLPPMGGARTCRPAPVPGPEEPDKLWLERQPTDHQTSANSHSILASPRSTWYVPTMRQKKLSDEIREAVLTSGMSRYSIAKALGVAESTMSRFVNGKGGLSMEYFDRLAELLGLHIVVESSKKRRDG